MDNRETLTVFNPVVAKLLKAIGAPDKATGFVIRGDVETKLVTVEVTFIASIDLKDEIPIELCTKKYTLVESIDV